MEQIKTKEFKQYLLEKKDVLDNAVIQLKKEFYFLSSRDNTIAVQRGSSLVNCR